MALVPKAIGKLVEAKVLATLASEFGAVTATNSDVMAQWQKQAKVHGAAAEALIEAILANGQVAPGIPSTPVATVGPGKII